MNNAAEIDSFDLVQTNGLNCPDTVWDCSKCEIVSRMTDDEQNAMLRRTTQRLVSQTPAIQEGMASYQYVRNVLAECMVMQLQLDAGYGEQTSESFARRKQTADKQMSDIRKVTNLYRRATGYRACCTWQTAEKGSLDVNLKNDMVTLGNLQAAHYRVLLLVDVVKHLNKIKDKQNGFDSDIIKSRFCKDLTKHSSIISEKLLSLSLTLQGQQASQVLAEHQAQYPLTNDNNIEAINNANAVTGVFRLFNTELSNLAGEAINEYSRKNNREFHMDRLAI